MAAEEEYVARIRRITSYEELQQLWSDHTKDKDSKDDWAKGKLLEYMVLRAFELEFIAMECKYGRSQGHVTYPYSVGYPTFDEQVSDKVLEQIDGVICCNGLYAMVEFKDYTRNKISVEPLAKMRNMLARRHANVFGMFFSATSFTTPAQIQVQFMAPQIIILWGFEDMDYCMRHSCFVECMEWKYRQAIERCEYYLNYYQFNPDQNECQPLL